MRETLKRRMSGGTPSELSQVVRMRCAGGLPGVAVPAQCLKVRELRATAGGVGHDVIDNQLRSVDALRAAPPAGESIALEHERTHARRAVARRVRECARHSG